MPGTVEAIFKAFGIGADALAFAPQSWETIGVLISALAAVITLHLRYERRIASRLELLGEMKHKASHLLRDAYFDLDRLHGATQGWTPETLSRELESTGTKFVNYVSELLSGLSDHQVNVCIKAIDNPRQGYPTTKEDWSKVFVYTLCRSARSKPRPTSLPKLVAVSQNTDFLLIMRDEGDSFAMRNLKRYDNKLKRIGNKEGYLNSTPSWPDFYVTTIVAPIRIEAAHLGVQDVRYDLLGFLCADSLSTRAFPKKDIEHYAQLMLSFGDDLYQYFQRVTAIGEEIKAKNLETTA